LNLVGDYECVDTNFSAGDSWGDGCAWYVGSEDYCGHYDTADFIASEMCCACSGGTAQVQSCLDTGYDTAGDSTGDHCEWYSNYPSGCGLYDTWEFKANEMCCACQADCRDSEYDGRDWGGDDCSWYVGNEYWCGSYDDDDFVAADMCCACSKANDAWLNLATYAEGGCSSTDSTTGNSDIGGDGCSWYDSNPGYCGLFDTESFKAGEECCGCGGGMYYGNACGDLDEGTGGDTGGDGCEWYNNGNEAFCGAFDTWYFSSSDMCCGCGGGLSAICASTSGPFKDTGGDGCDWYEQNPDYCGWFDDDDFDSSVCCGCGVMYYNQQVSLKANVNTDDKTNQYIFAFIVMCLVGAGVSYNYGKRNQAAEKKKTSDDQAYVKNNVTEKLI